MGVQRFCVGVFSWLWVRLRVVFHGVNVDVAGFSCFSALRVSFAGLIVATSAGRGLQQQQQQQLLFYVVDLSCPF